MMKNLLNRILSLPKITPDQLGSSLEFNHKIIELENSHRELNEITKSEIKSKIDETSPILGMFYGLNTEILNVWQIVQNRNFERIADIFHGYIFLLEKSESSNDIIHTYSSLLEQSKKVYNADNILPIYISLLENVSESFSLQQYITIRKKLYDLLNLISPIDNPCLYPDEIRWDLELLIANLITAIDYKFPSVREEANAEDETELSLSNSDLNEEKSIPTSSSAKSLASDFSDLSSDSEISAKESPDLKAVIEILKEKEAMTALEDQKKNLAREIKARDLKKKINDEIDRYKSILSEYIQKELESEPNCVEFVPNNESMESVLDKYGNPVINKDEKEIKSQRMDNMVSNFISALNNEATTTLANASKALAKKNLNLTRAIANYNLVRDMEKKLNPGYEALNTRLPLTKRLEILANDYPNIGKSLAKVGDKAVDKATSGIIGFFKKIFSSIGRYFSPVYSVEKGFNKTINKCRSQFFKMVGKLSPEEEKELKLIQKQERNDTRITRQVV